MYNERTNLPTATQVVEHLRHRALQSPQAKRLAEYIANRFKEVGSREICIDMPMVHYNGRSLHSIEITNEDRISIGLDKVCRAEMYYKRVNNRYYICDEYDKQESEWMDVTDTIIPCKYASDTADLTEKYFILAHLGYNVKRGGGEVIIRLPHINYQFQ